MRTLATIGILTLVVSAIAGRVMSEGTSPAADTPAARYQVDSEAAGAVYAKAAAAIQTDSQERYAAAKAEYDGAMQRAKEAYVKTLEADLARETKAGNEKAAETIRQTIDFTVNGPPRNDVQKLWAASYSSENVGDFDSALEAVEKIIKATGNSKNTFTQLRLGWLRYLKGQYDQAEAAYKTAAALSPRCISPLQGLVNCYLAEKRPDDAINAARELLKLDPMNPRANKTLGDLYYAKEEYARAGAYYQRLVTAHTEDFDAASCLGWCYVKLNHKPLALQIFNDVLAVQPDSALASSGWSAANEKTTGESAGVEPAESKIVLRNPKGAARPVSYTLNGQYPVTLKPGSDQTLDSARPWIIRFEQSGSKGQVQVRLEPGRYEFKEDGTRWKLSRK